MSVSDDINSLHKKRHDLIRKIESEKLNSKNYITIMKQFQIEIDNLNILLLKEKELERKEREKMLQKQETKLDKQIEKLRKKK